MRRVLRGIGRLVTWLVSAAVAALLLAGLGVLVLPRLLGYEGLIVYSGSMQPALEVGGLAFVRPVDDLGEIAVGDIITYRSARDERALVTHRVIGVSEDEQGRPLFETQGDANNVADRDPVTADRFQGRVDYHLPYVGYIAERLRQRNTFVAIIAIPALLLIVAELRVIVREIRKHRAEQRAAAAAGEPPIEPPADLAHAPEPVRSENPGGP